MCKTMIDSSSNNRPNEMMNFKEQPTQAKDDDDGGDDENDDNV